MFKINALHVHMRRYAAATTARMRVCDLARNSMSYLPELLGDGRQALVLRQRVGEGVTCLPELGL